MTYYQTASDELTERIRQSMREHKVTIKKVAEKAKISRQGFYNVMRAPEKADFGLLMKIAYYAGVQQITVRTGRFI